MLRYVDLILISWEDYLRQFLSSSNAVLLEIKLIKLHIICHYIIFSGSVLDSHNFLIFDNCGALFIWSKIWLQHWIIWMTYAMINALNRQQTCANKRAAQSTAVCMALFKIWAAQPILTSSLPRKFSIKSVYMYNPLI